MIDYARADAKQAARDSFHGIWAALTTPFAAGGGVDDDALVRDVERLAGPLRMDGLFCTGVMAEFWSLSMPERQRSVRLVVEASAGRLPVLAHTGHHSAADTIALTRQAADAGADFAVVINPYYPAGSDDGLCAWFTEVLDNVDIGVWLFDTNYSGVSLSLDLIKRLADTENVCGIKVGHDHARYLEILAAVGDRILVCEPSEAHWLENIRDHGQRVYMSSASPYLIQTPSWQPMREYTELALSGDFDAAAKASAQLDPVRALSTKWLHGQWVANRINPVPFMKAWGELLGMSGGLVRPPLSQVTQQQRDEIRKDLETVGLI
ncbi:MAG TPA: dihydrodipicolinate synthase family protein [Acidothermaceae bacterium]|nr:dihydrodipicolinate synthase family protein [Clostridia bacterium]